MKIKLTLLFSVFALLTYAQEEIVPEKRVTLGLKFAANASLFTKTVAPFDGARDRQFEHYQSDYRGTGSGGVTARLDLKKGFSLDAEVLFSPRGMAFKESNQRVITVDDEGNESFAFNNYNYNIDYIELPVMVNYKFQQVGKDSYVSGYVGFAPGTVVNRKTKIRYEEARNGERSKGRYETFSLNIVRPFNTNIIGGVQLEGKPENKLVLYGDLRFNYTLMPVFDRDTNAEGRNLNTHMITASLGFGFRF